MTSETDWSHDYCLYCDKQTLGGLYCSQACRLADLEAPQSAPVSPGYAFGDSDSLWGFTMPTEESSYTSKQPAQFQLPPPFDFEKYRATTSSSRLESPPLSPRTAGDKTMKLTRPTPPQRASSAQTHSKTRSLNTSSSRSSLSSVTSTGSSSAGLSEQALSQLQNYSNSFDHTRDWKRRVTLG